MDDRELLVLAAKAAGIKLSWLDGLIPVNATGTSPMANIYSLQKWNPLTDDGDALRLAVKLRFNLENWRDDIVTTGRLAIEPAVWPIWEIRTDDECADVRRAIVRAAAEIGRAMP